MFNFLEICKKNISINYKMPSVCYRRSELISWATTNTSLEGEGTESSSVLQFVKSCSGCYDIVFQLENWGVVGQELNAVEKVTISKDKKVVFVGTYRSLGNSEGKTLVGTYRDCTNKSKLVIKEDTGCICW